MSRTSSTPTSSQTRRRRWSPTRTTGGRFDGGRIYYDPDQDAADEQVVDLITAQDVSDPMWQKRLRPLPTDQALALAPQVRTIAIQVPVRTAGLLARAAREDGISRSAWVRRLLSDTLSRRYAVPAAELDTMRSNDWSVSQE